MQEYLNGIDDKHKIVVSSGGLTVECPLPDDFGLTIGSSYTTLFDLGSLNGALSKGAAFLSISQKVGVSMKRMFTNPEPSEISFEMEFAAYHDALSEVVIPIKSMLLMAAPSTMNFSEGLSRVREISGGLEEVAHNVQDSSGDIVGGVAGAVGGVLGQIDAALGNLQAQPETSSSVQKAMDIIGFIQGPDKATVRFGNVLTLRDAFISSVGFRMSNVLDSRGYPMKGSCSVTVVLENTPLKHSVNEWFN